MFRRCWLGVPVLVLLCATAAHADWSHDPQVNLAVSAGGLGTGTPALLPDGAGGYFIAWGRNGVYVQDLTATGEPRAGWPAGGRLVCSATGLQYNVAAASDGAGGLILAWQDTRDTTSFIYCQRVLASGGIPSGWPLNGLRITDDTIFQGLPQLAADGAGGAIVVWEDIVGSSDYDIHAQHVQGDGSLAAGWPAGGLVLCSQPDYQQNPVITTDDAGGAYIAWEDRRSGTNYDLYGQHVTGAGAILWTAQGELLTPVGGSPLSGDQLGPRIAPDNVGNMYLAYTNYASSSPEIFVERLTPAGSQIASATGYAGLANPSIAVDDRGYLWFACQDYSYPPSNGASDIWLLSPGYGGYICTAYHDQLSPRIVLDGIGGALVVWLDQRAGIPSGSGFANQIYAQHVDSNIQPLTGWPVDGRPVCLATGDRGDVAVLPDGEAGVIAAWLDLRASQPGLQFTYTGATYAERVDRFGHLGYPAPTLTSVADFPADQGGKVRLQWTASYIDTFPSYEVSQYGIWRQVTAAAAQAAVRHGATWASAREAAAGARPGLLRTTVAGGQTLYWEGVSTVAARGDSVYTFTAPTFQDSVGASNPLTTFMVDAHAAFVPEIWTGAPDSGYSVDNLAPPAPSPFTGVYASGVTYLHWGLDPAPDFSTFRVYRGTTAAFTPTASTMIAAGADTGYADAGPAGGYYKLSAVDVHGNESPYAVLGPTDVTGTGSPPAPTRLALGRASPDPAHGVTTIDFELPRASFVSLEVFDGAGREIRELVHGAVALGRHEARWNGEDRTGARVRPGVYIVRLSALGRELSERCVRL